MLVLVGMGVCNDLTSDGLNEIKSADEIYLETYTSPLDKKSREKLEKKIKKAIIEIGREMVESRFLVNKAKEKKIILLVSGDPLIATTHIALVIDAKRQKVPTKVIHNSSIYTVAAGVSGLQIYRFGKTASLVNPRENYAPKSSLEIIRENLSHNMHTLILLDTEPEPMGAKKALGLLEEFDSAFVISRAGAQDEKISYGKIKELKEKHLGKPPFCIIIPATLHMVEEEYASLLNVHNI